MLGYYISAGICLFLLVMMPIWSSRHDQPTYPFVVIVLLVLAVLLVPLMLRRRAREGASDPGKLIVTVEAMGGERRE